MREIGSLELKNVVLFKEAKLPLKRKGLTVIRGFNADADRSNSEDNTNASGKSLLVSALANVIRGTDAVKQSIKSRTKKDLFSEKTSSIILRGVKQGKDTYDIEKRSKGNSIEYVIHRNGEDLKIRGVSFAEEKVQDIFPYNDDEFFTLYYIDSRKPNPLQFGSPVQRLEFFTNLFKQHSYDVIRKHLNGRLSELKGADSRRLEHVKNEIQENEKEVGGFSETELFERLETLKKKQKGLLNRQRALYRGVERYNKLQSTHSTYLAFRKLCKTLKVKVEKSRKEKSGIESRLAAYNKAQKELQAYIEYKREKEKLKKELRETENNFDVEQYEKLKRKKEKASDLLSRARAQVRTHAHTRASAQEHTRLRKKAKAIRKSESKIEKSLSKVNHEIARLKKESQRIKSLTNHAKCPTCKQDLNEKGLRKILASYEKRLRSLKEKSDKTESNLNVLRELKVQDGLKRIAYLESKLSKYSKELERLKKEKEKHDRKEWLQSKLKKLDVVKKPKECKEDAKALEKWLASYTILSPVLSDHLSSNTENLEIEYKSAKKELDAIQSEIHECNKQVPVVSAQYERIKNLNASIQKLKKEKASLKRKLKDIPVLEALIEAYSNKGIKLVVIKHIAKIVENNMNHYAPLLYKEKIKFSLEVRENSFDILMQRGKRTSDVRNLSGAESRAFSFLLPLALFPLIPKDRRLNIMVMDEPNANMDSSMSYLFTHNFIPKLLKVVPHVIVVTPLQDTYPKAKYYRVVKKGGTSILEKLGRE